MDIPTLETPHLILRPWSLDDSRALFRILQEPDILKYFPPTDFTLEKAQRYINHQLSHWQERGYGHWAVTLKEDLRLVGWDGLEFLPETEESEVAYLLSHQVWGRGFATEAAQAAVKFWVRICRFGGHHRVGPPGKRWFQTRSGEMRTWLRRP